MSELLVLRADASQRQGTGHVMRCLALAHAWRADGGEACFASRLPASLVQRIRDDGFLLAELGERCGEAAELEAVRGLLRGTERPWIALDGYDFPARYSTALRAFGRVLAIDDFGSGHEADADMHLDQNLDGGRPGGYPEEALALLGPSFALLRPEFGQVPVRDPGRPCRNILVTLGGGDHQGLTEPLLRALAPALPLDICLRVVVGAASPQAAALRSLSGRLGPNVEVHEAVQDMAALMAQCDLAVTAAGSTVWELACMGVPFVALPLAANQEPVARSLERSGWSTCPGPVSGLEPARVAQAIREQVETLLGDAVRRASLATAGRQMVDGRGARRVVRAMRALAAALPDRLPLLPATREDILDVWRLACQPSVRANSLQSGAIAWAEHETWFNRQLASTETLFLLCRLGGCLAGQIRFESRDDMVLVNFSVSAPFRGLGLGRRLLAETWQNACRQLGHPRAHGLVLADNAPSRACFVHAGFSQIGVAVHGGREFLVFEGVCA